MTECIVITPTFYKETLDSLLKFVDCELCSCARETFSAEMIHRDIKEALFKAAINEMVLRGLAEKVGRGREHLNPCRTCYLKLLTPRRNPPKLL